MSPLSEATLRAVGRIHRQALQAPEPLDEPLVVGVTGREALDERLADAPVVAQEVHRGLALVNLARPVVVGRPGRARVGRVQDQVGKPLGRRRGEQHRHRAALVERHHGRAVGSGRVEHRVHVVDLLLERGRLLDPLRHAGPAAVEHDQARERRQPGEEARDRRVVPDVLHGGDRLRHVEQVDRAVAEGRPGDRPAVARGDVVGRRRHGVEPTRRKTRGPAQPAENVPERPPVGHPKWGSDPVAGGAGRADAVFGKSTFASRRVRCASTCPNPASHWPPCSCSRRRSWRGSDGARTPHRPTGTCPRRPRRR